MPRDASGTYTLPLPPVVAGTTITVTWANTTLADIEQALTDSLDRNGNGGMNAPLLFADGTEIAPGIAWQAEVNSGFYRAGAGDMRMTLQGSDLVEYKSTEVTFNTTIMAIGVDSSKTLTFIGDTGGYWNVNGNNFGSTAGLNLSFAPGAIDVTKETSGYVMNTNTSLASGGSVFGLDVINTQGGATAHGLRAGVRVNPIVQLSGAYAPVTEGLNNGVDETTKFNTINSPADDVNMFVAQNNTLEVGSNLPINSLQFLLVTVASEQGIGPKFEYSTGPGTWQEFNPIDGTNGMLNSGCINWSDETVATPAFVVGDGGLYRIRVTRQAPTLTTNPVATFIQQADSSQYSWDEAGDLTVNDITARDITLSGDLVAASGGFAGSFTVTDSALNLTFMTDEDTFNGYWNGTLVNRGTATGTETIGTHNATVSLSEAGTELEDKYSRFSPSQPHTAAYNAVAFEPAKIDTSGGAFTATLPASPNHDDLFFFYDSSSTWVTDNFTIARNGKTIANVAEDLVCDVTNGSVVLMYDSDNDNYILL